MGFLIVSRSDQMVDSRQMDGYVLDALILAVHQSPRGFDVRIPSLAKPRLIFALIRTSR
jgi:hypothetical protein